MWHMFKVAYKLCVQLKKIMDILIDGAVSQLLEMPKLTWNLQISKWNFLPHLLTTKHNSKNTVIFDSELYLGFSILKS